MLPVLRARQRKLRDGRVATEDVPLRNAMNEVLRDEYVATLRASAGDDPRIVFTGFAYGDLLAELYTNAAAFVQPSRLEGLPPQRGRV